MCQTFAMRHALASPILALFLFPSFAIGETMDDLIFRSSDGLHYKKYTEFPFTGKVTGREQRLFKNGMRVGLWVHYHIDGWLESKGTIKDGKKTRSLGRLPQKRTVIVQRNHQGR